MTIKVTDFSQYTAGSAPSDWTRRWAGSGSWTITAGAGKDGVSNAMRSSGLASGRNAISWNALDGLSGRETVDILGRVKSSIAANQDFQFVARGSGAAATETGYRGGIANNTRRTDRYDSGTAYGSWSTANTQTGASIPAETWYLVRFHLEGGLATVKTWADDGVAVEPGSPQFSVSDPSPNITPGFIGFFQSVVNGVTTWDQVAFATGGDIATFSPATEIVVTDTLNMGDPGSSFNVAQNIVIVDNLGLTDARVSDLVSQFNLVITDRVGLADSRLVNLAAVQNVTVVDSIDLLDDALIQTLIPGDTGDPGGEPDTQAIARGTGIIEELVAAGYTMGTIMDRERLRLLDKTGANPVAATLQDLYRIAGERPRL